MEFPQSSPSASKSSSLLASAPLPSLLLFWDIFAPTKANFFLNNVAFMIMFLSLFPFSLLLCQFLPHFWIIPIQIYSFLFLNVPLIPSGSPCLAKLLETPVRIGCLHFLSLQYILTRLLFPSLFWNVAKSPHLPVTFLLSTSLNSQQNSV